jgi:tetratricopeptide (TPR) repeat protein
MHGIRGFRFETAILLAFSACATTQEVTPASDYREAWQSARASFARANSLMHEGLLALSASDLKALVDAEERLGRGLLEELRSVTEAGAGQAGAAVELRSDGVEGHLYLALNLAILGLTKGRVTALLEGLPGRIEAAYERALSLDPGYAAGGGYRLKGKFLTSAPWPIRDYPAAGRALERANEIAPVRQNFLFLGDLRWREGRRDEAVAMWRRACATPVHPETAAIDDAVLELARRRVAAESQE